MRPTLATFGTLNPLGSPTSKYRLSARLRKLRITSGNVMRQTANVKCRFTRVSQEHDLKALHGPAAEDRFRNR